MRSRRSTPSCHDTWEKLLSMGLCLIPIIKRFSLFSPVVRQLQGNLDEGIWAHLLFLDELFPIVTEFMDIHVQILHQPDQNNKLWQKLFSYVCVCGLILSGHRPLEFVSRRADAFLDLWRTFPVKLAWSRELTHARSPDQLWRAPNPGGNTKSAIDI